MAPPPRSCGWSADAGARSRRWSAAAGADFGPDGALYLLEREVRTLGFRSRIRRIDLSDGGTVEGTVVWAPPVTWGNLEGLSVWTDGEGQMRMTMVADDNFLSVLPGGLVEIVLDNSGRGL